MNRNGDLDRHVEQQTKGLGAACERLVIIKYIQRRVEELKEGRAPQSEKVVLLDMAQFIRDRFRET